MKIKWLSALSLALALLVAPTVAQAQKVPIPYISNQYFNNTGAVAAGYKLCTFSAGTTTPATTWSDALGISANTNPVTLDSSGRANIFLTNGTFYKFELHYPGTGSSCGTSSVGALVWTRDNIRIVPPTTAGAVNVIDYGAKCDGTTDDRTAIQAAVNAALGPVFLPQGTCVIGSAVNAVNNTIIFGNGKGLSTLKAKNSAALSYMIYIDRNITGVQINNLTIDGNRAGGGMPNSFSAAVYIKGSRAVVDNVEIKQSQWAGVFIGDDATAVTNTRISNSWIHDNGGVTNDSGNGIGVFAGGATLARDIKILNNRIESNYNTVTKPNDATALNLTATGILIDGNTLVDNFNVNGGQMVVGDSTVYPPGDEQVDAQITNNKCYRNNPGFGTPVDKTGCVEVAGRGFSIANNYASLGNSAFAAIRIEGSNGSANGTITGNVLDTCTYGVDINDADPSFSVVITGNYIGCSQSPGYGIGTNSGQSSILINGNNLSGSTVPLVGTFSTTSIAQNNLPFGSTANYQSHLTGVSTQYYSTGSAVTITAANDLILGYGDLQIIAGNTTINRIATQGVTQGDIKELFFTGTPQVTDNVATGGGYAKIKLAGSANWNATANARLVVQYINGIWYQISRTVD